MAQPPEMPSSHGFVLGQFRGLGEGADLPRVHYVVLRPARDEIVRRAQARTAEDALVDEEPIVSLWAQFSYLGALESHAIDTTDQEPADTVRAVRDAIASDRFLLDLATVRTS